MAPPSFPPARLASDYPPVAPRTPRTLRKLQSAHSLGAKANAQAYLTAPIESFISQHRATGLGIGSSNLFTSGLPAHHTTLPRRPSQIPQPSPSGSISSINSIGPPPGPGSSSLQNIHHHTSQLLNSVKAAQTAAPHITAAAQASAQLQSSPIARTGNVSPQRRPGGDGTISAGQSPAAKRVRSSSDAGSNTPVPGEAVRVGRPQYANLGMSVTAIIRDGPPDGNFPGTLETLRYKILEEGIKSDSDGMSSVRIYVWLILLNAPILPTDDYLSLVHRSASPAYAKIRNDTFRTLTTDPLFRRRVSEASLIRLLNAIAWRLHDGRERTRRERKSLGAPTDRDVSPVDVDMLTSSPAASKHRARALTLTTESDAGELAPEPGTYVQGMNVLAAPFLYAARSEAEAFTAFYALLTRECPGYIRGAMEGVHEV